VLDEVELLVAGGRPEVGAVVGEGLFVGLAVVVEDGDRGLLAEGGIREDDLGLVGLGGLGAEGVVGLDRGVAVVVVGADAVQEQVHGAQATDPLDELDAAQGLVAKVPLLVLVELVVALDVLVGGEEEPAGAAGRVDDALSGLRLDAIDHGVDEGARGEVLAGAALRVLGVLLQEALVRFALHVGGHGEPGLLADELDDELAELGRVLDLVLGLAEDEAEHAAGLAQLGERLAVVVFEADALHLGAGEVGPAVALGDGLLVAGHLGALLGHLEEEEGGELFEVVLVGEAVVPEDVAEGPESLDDAVRLVAHEFFVAAAVFLGRPRAAGFLVVSAAARSARMRARRAEAGSSVGS
jgi:hypothetical protein